MIIEIIFTPTFKRASKKLLKDAELSMLLEELSLNPKSGKVIRDTGGFRKVRLAKSGSGKSGGYRVVYIFIDREKRIYLIDLFMKSTKENLSKEERNMLLKISKTFKS